jgi:hypothetical protein
LSSGVEPGPVAVSELVVASSAEFEFADSGGPHAEGGGDGGQGDVLLRAISVLAAPFKPGQVRLVRQSLAMDSAPLAFDVGPSLALYPWLRGTEADAQA